ncbi:MAG: right-handed parallel beta-helix repeat-containing protein [Acidobacteriota bacterium]|nr:right-handed parallel beta-helix repeat-containing protein [Acidobacteriota bacterium]
MRLAPTVLSSAALASAVLALLSMSARAQDTRSVAEPVVPAVCAVVPALLRAPLSAAEESRLDTDRIQQALDHCPRGQAVALRAVGGNNALLTGPLQLRTGVTLLVDRGVTLFASRDAALYATVPGGCGVVTQQRAHNCRPLIAADHVEGAAIMGEGAIDGRGGATILGKDVSWWQLAEQARAGGSQQVPRILVAEHANNLTLYRITLRNSPNFHVVFNHGDGLTVWGVTIDTPQRLARNTDGIDPGGSRNITITHSYIRTGDDNVAIKGGDPITNVTISHNHFYWGHGMSIGSETNGGVSKVRVYDLSLDGPDSGIRIKSMGTRGGIVQDVVYDDVCVRNSPRPIDLSAAYAANGAVLGNSPPTFRDITLHNVRVSGGGRILFDGYDATHRVSVRLDGVQLTDAASARYSFTVNHADLVLGPGASNLVLPAGTDSTRVGSPVEAVEESCAAKFLAFPVD